MSAPVLLHHPSSLEHDTGAHPESARRIVAIERALAQRDWLGFDVRLSDPASRASIEALHPAHHLDRIEALCARGGGMIDVDTVVSPGSCLAAYHAAGGAVQIVDALLGEHGVGVAASLHRPPGHHAEAERAMGFCLLNNVAIAAQHALDEHGAQRVMIFDWDVHHGNGTEALFSARDDVLFCSIHQSPLYPGSGAAAEVGRAAGEGYTVNLPVPGGSGDAVWRSLVEHVVLPLGRAYGPDLLLLSAGYDAHADDPLAGCLVSDDGYRAMAASVRALAGELVVPLGIVLEGGYDLGALSRCVTLTLETAGASPDAAHVSSSGVAVDPLAEQAARRLAQSHWPALVAG